MIIKPQEYKIVIHSITRFIIAVTIIFCLSLILIADYTPRIDNLLIEIILILAVFTISIYLAQLFGKAKIKISFTKEGFNHVWEKRFLFSWEKDLTIPWEMIDNWVIQEDRTFDSFIISLTFKRRYKINRLNIFPINDDFKKFILNFSEISDNLKNSKNFSNTMKIKEGKSIYKSKAFRWIYCFMLIGFIFLLLSKIINSGSSFNWSSLGVIGIGLGFYGAIILEKNNDK